jgi:hypothetical protein
LLLAFFCLPATAGAQPVLSFDEQVVVIEGLAPGGRAAVFGIGRGMEGFMPVRVEVWEMVDADGEGVARLDLQLPVELAAGSVWAAVDLSAGETALAAPEGVVLHEISFPVGGLPGGLTSLDDGRPSLGVLWVRPGTDPAASGAWGGRIEDGGPRDGDGAQNRRLRALLDRLEPLGNGGPPPRRLAPGDVLVGIDPATLEIYTARLAG